MFTFSYADGSNELSVVQFKMSITGTSFQDGTDVTDAVLNSVGDALESIAETICGHATSLILITEDSLTRDVPIT